MNLRQLEAFYWIVRLGGFGAAAHRLGATQPAISARIRELELSLGAPLFVRGRRTARMSARGRALFPLAEEALGVIARIRAEIADAPGIGGVVRIGMGEIVALSWFPAFLAKVSEAWPSVRIQAFMDVTNNLNRMLDESALDLALVVTPREGSFVSQSVGSTPLYWMGAPSLVGSKATPGPDELSGLPVYTLTQNSHLHTKTMNWFQTRGCRPRMIHSCNNLGVIMKLVTMGRGIALIPPILTARELADGDLRLLSPDSEERTEFFLVRHRDEIDPAILKIAEMAIQTTVFHPTR